METALPHARLMLALPLLGAFVACGRGPAEPSAAAGDAAQVSPEFASTGLLRLPLVPLTAVPEAGDTVVLHAEGDLQQRGWVRSESSSDSPRLFALRPEDRVRLRMDLPQLERLPTRVLFEARVPLPMVAHLALGEADGPLAEAEGLLRAGAEPGIVAFDVPEVLFQGRAPTFIELEIERLPLGQRSGVIVRPLSVSLEFADPAELLPAHGALEFAGPRSLGRRAASLARGGRLGSRVVAAEGSELRVGFCVPPEFRHPDDRPRLAVRIKAADGSGASFDFEAAPRDAQQPWRTAVIDVAEFAGAELELEFEWSGELQGELLGLVAEPLLARAADRPPVVVLITSDTHRGDHLGAVRDGVEVATPFLDGLAAKGALFEDARASANSTNPSHTTLMTGTSPAVSGILDNDTPLSEAAPTLAEAFREAGYLTVAATSAVHLGADWSGLGQGFDRYSAPERPQRDSEVTLDELFGSLDGTEGLPLFVWFHTFDAHSPYTPPDGFVDPYYPTDRDPRDASAPYANLALLPDFDLTITDPDYTEALYKAEVTYLDGQLQELLAHPRLQGALVALTSDHGEGLAADPVPFQHVGLSPSTLDVPLLLSGPGVPAGLVSAAPAAQLDLGRTLLDLAGLTESPFPGANLLDAATMPPDRPRFAMEASGMTATVERDGWMLMLSLRVPKGAVDTTGTRPPRHGVALFNLGSDPHLHTDVARDHGPLTRELRALLVEWLATSIPGRFASAGLDGSDVAAQLAILGYAEGDKLDPNEIWIDPDCTCPRCAPFNKQGNKPGNKQER